MDLHVNTVSRNRLQKSPSEPSRQAYFPSRTYLFDQMFGKIFVVLATQRSTTILVGKSSSYSPAGGAE